MNRSLFFILALLLACASVVSAQTSGAIEGTVRDAQGLVMPGVTVVLTGSAVLGSQTATTVEDGTYRFRALGPGTYNLRFELAGFQTLNREGIIVGGGRTITVNVSLDVATVAETITVTGESPVVDVKNTALSNEFDTSELQDVPSATDVWAVLAQTAGVRMTGYDVGGSHKSQQSGYESFGIRDQNRVLSEGVDSTEGTGGTGFYYDYYSVEEFTTTAAGADVEMSGPGSMIMMTIKSGGNDFSGLVHYDYEGEKMVSDNVDDELRQRGYTGNPNLLFYEFHGDVGGPILRDRAWFYGFYNHFRIDKAISGVDAGVATDIGDFDGFGGKVNIKLTEKDTFIGYSQWGLKEKPNRGLSVTIPPESILAQASWSWVHKGEWQRVWSDRAFTNFQLKHFGFGWPMVPAVDPASNPPRIDQATGIRSGAGWNTTAPPFFLGRWKPQVTATMNYYVPAKAGSHDFKFGFDWQVDSSQYGSNADSGTVRYFDNSALGRPHNVDEISIFNVRSAGPNLADNRDKHTDLFAQDTWTLNSRLTMVLGLRFGRQDAYYLESVLDPDEKEFFPTGTIPAMDLVTWNTLAPRLGVTYDISGDGKTVLKGHYGRYYINLADNLSTANPANFAYVRYKFLDQNQNGMYDGSQELGTLVRRLGTTGATIEGAEGTPVNPDLQKMYSDEFAFSVEREVAENTGLRFSYVRKQLRNIFPNYGSWNRGQVIPLLQSPVPCGDAAFPCPVNPLTGQAITTVVRVPDSAADAQDWLIDTLPEQWDHSDYDTIQVAFNRRFAQDFFVQGSFDYQWRNELRSAEGESQSPLSADPLGAGQYGFWQNHNQGADTVQENTNWQAKFLGRYVFPKEIATSANLRVQSGWPYAPILYTSVPGTGTAPIFVEDIQNNRSETVTIVDLRVEKMFSMGTRATLAGMVDFYNLFNSNPETNFVIRTGSAYRRIIAALDPRAIKVGVRFQF